ncbi:replication initiation O-like [Lactobacillus phage Ld17]|uniref:Putative DNA replication protein n=1 Tax=Lactobacillus phage Ld17 TaxID=1500733 RepID=A0A075KK88_9CAUD|nr:replication initiation O-like [Lactobacillus phage Ld17]AIF54410.1 putative DNA replication protein [Lactobacillus phage Ld17]
MSIISLIASNNYIVVNKDVLQKLGVYPAIILGELASEYNYYNKTRELVDGMFYSTIENIQSNTTLSRHQQNKAISKLKELGILEVVVKGIPAKRYFKLNENKLIEMFVNEKNVANNNVNNLHTGVSETDKRASKKLTGNNNNNSNKENSNNIKKERKKESKKTMNYDSIINESIQDESVKKEIYEFIKMRKLIKKPMTDRALKGLISKLNELSSNPVDQAKILERSVINDWQSVYPLPSNNNGYRNNNGYQGNTEVKRDGSDYAEFDL